MSKIGSKPDLEEQPLLAAQSDVEAALITVRRGRPDRKISALLTTTTGDSFCERLCSTRVFLRSAYCSGSSISSADLERFRTEETRPVVSSTFAQLLQSFPRRRSVWNRV